MKLYGIREKKSGELLSFYQTTFLDEDTPVIVFELDRDPFQNYFWLVTEREIAEEARKTNVPRFPRFLADYETPVNRYHPDDLEVVEFELFPSDLFKLLTGNLGVDSNNIFVKDEDEEDQEK